MSERGSFVTEYVYCKKCFEAIKPILVCNDKYLCSRVMPTWVPNEFELPIIAGKVGAIVDGGEVSLFETELIPKIEKVICHSLTIAVIPDDGCIVGLIAEPKKRKKEKK